MRLLITGAAGFLGRNALLAIPNSWQVVALHRPGSREFLTFLEAHQLNHVQPVACDLNFNIGLFPFHYPNRPIHIADADFSARRKRVGLRRLLGHILGVRFDGLSE